eukprot:RCo035984
MASAVSRSPRGSPSVGRVRSPVSSQGTGSPSSAIPGKFGNNVSNYDLSQKRGSPSANSGGRNRTNTPVQCSRCRAAVGAEGGASPREVPLKCGHPVCMPCALELCVDGALSCPCCTVRSFFEVVVPSPNKGVGGGSATLERLRTGTYCPQCGKSFIALNARGIAQISLKCDHVVCMPCAEVLCVDGALACPCCTRRTFFQQTGAKDGASPRQQPPSPANATALAPAGSLVRLATGTYCPQCGKSYMALAARGVGLATLTCGHKLCGSCASDLWYAGAAAHCPTCAAEVEAMPTLPNFRERADV